MATLVSLGHLELTSTLDAWLAIAAHPNTVRVLPITAHIAAEVARLPDTFQRDPADRLIVSTSRVHGLPVLTRDAAIAKSGLVRLWSPGGADAFLKLERQLSALDAEAWNDLKQRAAPHLVSRAREQGRGWQALFDLLNEAKAFAYLEKIGCTGVHFIERTKHKTADLGGILDGSPVLCEVKTINHSKGEADKRRRVGKGEVIASKISPCVDEGVSRKAQIDHRICRRTARG